MLDSLYGGGPETEPSYYEFKEAQRKFGRTVPRILFRLGPKRPATDGRTHCPFRDIGRGVPSDALDSGLTTDDEKNWATEAFLADIRNDSHALISQLTVLLKLFHNLIVERLQSSVPINNDDSETDMAYRYFKCARLIFTTIYRDIIKKDVLPKILHENIKNYYRDTRNNFAQTGFTPERAMRVFSYGAFRFGHSMIRESYRVNSDGSIPIDGAIQASSTHTPNRNLIPVDNVWIVDWVRFFEEFGQTPDWSRRIGPSVNPNLTNSLLFPAIREGTDRAGLFYRDNLSAAFADLPPLEDLFSAYSESGPEIQNRYSQWADLVKVWLENENPPPAGSEKEKFISKIASDPPLPFFFMFEAAHVASGNSITRNQGGMRLGELGSCVVAETFWKALRTQPILESEEDGTLLAFLDDESVKLETRLGAICDAMLGEPSAYQLNANSDQTDDLAQISSLPDLLEVIRNAGLFPSSGVQS